MLVLGGEKEKSPNFTTGWVLVTTVVSGDFIESVFFPAQLVSAQRLSALFPLRKFCCCLFEFEMSCVTYFLFDKNRSHKKVWGWVFHFTFF